MEYEQTKPKKYNQIKIKKNGTKMFFIKVNTKKTKAKETYGKAKAEHKAEIKKLKATIKSAKGDIKRHKLLKNQAKTIYKLAKV